MLCTSTGFSLQLAAFSWKKQIFERAYHVRFNNTEHENTKNNAIGPAFALLRLAGL